MLDNNSVPSDIHRLLAGLKGADLACMAAQGRALEGVKLIRLLLEMEDAEESEKLIVRSTELGR